MNKYVIEVVEDGGVCMSRGDGKTGLRDNVC